MMRLAALGSLILPSAAPPLRVPTGHPPDFYTDKPDPGPFAIFSDTGETTVSEGSGKILDTALKFGRRLIGGGSYFAMMRPKRATRVENAKRLAWRSSVCGA